MQVPPKLNSNAKPYQPLSNVLNNSLATNVLINNIYNKMNHNNYSINKKQHVSYPSCTVLYSHMYVYDKHI